VCAAATLDVPLSIGATVRPLYATDIGSDHLSFVRKRSRHPHDDGWKLAQPFFLNTFFFVFYFITAKNSQ
jgi:hypothetical protein